MPINYTTPGVYVEEIPRMPLSVAQVETAIPAFIGYTEKAMDAKSQMSLTNKPTRIASLLDYEESYGKAQAEDGLEVTLDQAQSGGLTTAERITVAFNRRQSKHNMYYSLQAYFANGGGPCYIVSVGAYKALNGAPVLTELAAGLAKAAKEDGPTLLVFPEGQNLPAKDHYALLVEALTQCATLQDRFVIMDLHETGAALVTAGDVNAAAADFRAGVAPAVAATLRHGAAYFPNVVTGLCYAYSESHVNVVHHLNGARGPLDNHTLADLNTPGNAVFNQAAYSKLKQAVDAFSVILPPSPFTAGVYASVDANRGVWKAPANVALSKAIGLTFKVTNELQDGLNVDPDTGKSINCIREFPVRGILVWGARTLAGNDNEWRYISVRRFSNMVEKSCKLATRLFIFERNDSPTWTKVQSMLESFLSTLWRQGALQGAKPEHAFYIAVGLGKTMTNQDILEGRLVVEIGLAMVRPAEFIILRFWQKMASS